LIDTSLPVCPENENLKDLCLQQNVEYDIFAKAFAHTTRDAEYMKEILISFAQEFKVASKAALQIEKVSTELTQTYEELILLYNMSTNMKVTQSTATYLQMACDQITRSVNLEGIAIFLEKEKKGTRSFLLTAGSGVVAIDNATADILQIHLANELKEGKEALVDSNVDGDFKYNWPDTIKSMIAVPLHGSDKMIGFMVATNALDKPDFDRIDMKLFNSVANQCAVFIENNRLFGDLKELFIGSLKALTNSIDAKDQYTRGHSDRVAFISRWIAEKYAKK
jgi:GAF domain-containing protein